MANDEVDAKLDVCGVCCPLPLIQLSQAISKLDPGQVIEAIGNDPIFETSIRDFCQVNGHTILEVRMGKDRRVTIFIRRGDRP